jgi:hypothetical protein
VRHYEPPEVTWLPPELEVGVELEPRPLELELPEFEDDEPEELEPEDVEPEDEEPEDVEPEDGEPEEVEPDEVEPEVPELEDPEPELVEDELEGVEVEPVDVSVLWVEPGRARASAPAVTTLAIVTAVVVERTLLRPRSLAVTAWRIPSRCALLITLILRSGTRNSLYESSRQPLSQAARARTR